MAELRPGKGAFLQLNHEALEFLHHCFEDLWNAAGDEDEAGGEFPNIDVLQDAENGMQFLKDLRGSATHWVPSQDKFGIKLHKALPWESGEIRVTVVLKGNELKLDIRNWYDPDSITAKTPWSNK